MRFQECCKGKEPQIIKPSKKPVEVQIMEKMRASMKKFCMHPDIERYKGRDDYPVRAMWNSLLAGIVFQHESVEKLRRELARNGQLREICGFFNKVPPAWGVHTIF
jgi:hypothetical protein